MKRPLDVALSSAMLVVSAPVWAVIALAIKLEDGGPVFYQQERYGRGGTKFTVKKFRSMIVNADRAGEVRQATLGDSRITRVGSLLRATGLDELPQIWSIFKGDMSFVGPRALALGEKDQDGNPLHYDQLPGFEVRQAVHPGLTGLATIFLPKDATARRKFKVDSLYVRRQSLQLDMYLILLSFWISFRGKWETRDRKV